MLGWHWLSHGIVGHVGHGAVGWHVGHVWVGHGMVGHVGLVVGGPRLGPGPCPRSTSRPPTLIPATGDLVAPTLSFHHTSNSFFCHLFTQPSTRFRWSGVANMFQTEMSLKTREAKAKEFKGI